MKTREQVEKYLADNWPGVEISPKMKQLLVSRMLNAASAVEVMFDKQIKDIFSQFEGNDQGHLGDLVKDYEKGET